MILDAAEQGGGLNLMAIRKLCATCQPDDVALALKSLRQNGTLILASTGCYFMSKEAS